jgi:Glycosyl hydrolase family 99
MLLGTPQDGNSLTAGPGSWTGKTPIGFAYQWERCNVSGGSCAAIPGAASTGYDVVSADVGATIRVRVKATNSAGTTYTYSVATSAVRPRPAYNSASPTIAGTAREGQTLTASAGSWGGTPPLSLAYQWRRCAASGSPCGNIVMASSTTYKLTPADDGATIVLRVTASNGGGSVTADSQPTAAVIDPQPGFPIRAAFYYPWFPEARNQQGLDPFTHYNPSLGFYDSSATNLIEQHLQAMQYGNIQAGIASWWGQGSKTDLRFPALLAATDAMGSSLRWAIYYEPEGQGDPTVSQITADLTYVRDRYASDPAYLRINGRFVVFAYADGLDGCAMSDRWKQANTVGAYVVLKVFPGYRACTRQPDGWHQYAPAAAEDSQAGYSYTISPGFYKANETTPRLIRDLTRWNQNIKDMIASGAPFQLVTTFNEWGEGTAVESAQEWATPSGYGAYLDALHNNGS